MKFLVTVEASIPMVQSALVEASSEEDAVNKLKEAADPEVKESFKILNIKHVSDEEAALILEGFGADSEFGPEEETPRTLN